MQNPAIVEIFNLIGGVDAAEGVEAESASILAGDIDRNRLAWGQARDAGNREAVIASQAQS